MAQKRFYIDAGFETNDDSVIAGKLTVESVLLDGQDLATALTSGSATSNTYTDSAIVSLIDSAPATLNTLNALAAALGDDENFSATNTSEIALKSSINYVNTQIAAAAVDATTKADAAQAAAISAVTNGAGAAFDTLVEIQNAMATDAELSTAITDVTAAAASTASTDATTKANAAQAAAATDATTKADAAESAAIATAATDATTKADAAQAAAQAAAATDATSKANAVQSAAATDATTKADAAQAAAIASLVHFHSAVQTVTSGQETTNVTATVDFTFSDLTNAKHQIILLNRTVLRPDEYSVSGTTVTIAIGVLVENDEIEVTGLSS
mgnify:CR=1 FL=1